MICVRAIQFQTMMRLFEIRNNLKNMSLADFQRTLADQGPLDPLEYQHYATSAYQDKRAAFIQYLQAIHPYHNAILATQINNHPIFFEIAANGTADEIRSLIKIDPNISRLTQDGQALFSALRNKKRTQNNIEALEIIRIIIDYEPSFVNARRNKPLVAEAIEESQLQVAEFLLERGADCNFLSESGDNLLHLLMFNHTKQLEKQILALRAVLIERGVDENKKNSIGKKPLDLCPTLQKKVEQTEKKKNKEAREDYRKTKGKSEEGWQSQRQKVAEQGLVYLKLDNKFDEMQITKQANQLIQKFTQEKERELKRKKLEKGKEKEKQFKNRVMTPDELKFYLEEDIQYETGIIEAENKRQRTFLNQLVDNITQRIKKELGAHVQIFGSFATELCLPESDIDMVIIPEDSEESYSSFRLLENIYHLLEGMKEQVENAKFIKTASVPIIKIQCTRKYNEKKIDITYQDDNHNGLQSVALIQQYLTIYPQLRPLTIILKKFIYSARLFDPYSGGISSYGLILMIVAFLQNDNRQRKKSKNNKSEPALISEILIGFLRFYGFKCNYIGKTICVLQPQRARMEMQAKYLDMPLDPIYLTVMDVDQIYNSDWQPRAKLVILDPLNENNNVGRATHKIRQIRTAFEMAYVCIHTNKQCSNKKTCESYRRIRENVQSNIRYEGNRRPCCIIKRMLLSANTILIS